MLLYSFLAFIGWIVVIGIPRTIWFGLVGVYKGTLLIIAVAIVAIEAARLFFTDRPRFMARVREATKPVKAPLRPSWQMTHEEWVRGRRRQGIE